jgi:hypothetical protein
METRTHAGTKGLKDRLLASAFCLAICLAILLLGNLAAPAAQKTESTPAAPTGIVRQIGAIQAINGDTLTLSPDSGPQVHIQVQSAARIVRIAPGEKDLKNATPLQLQDLQVGDRVLVAGKSSADHSAVLASSVVVMKRSDLQARDQQNLQDWQKRGVDGLVKTVDPSAQTIALSARGKSLSIHASTTTVIRRYPPDSVKFEDAKPSTLQQIQTGDQLRARGEPNAEGKDFAAEEIVFGTFRNFAGTVVSVDASSSQLTVHDLMSKTNVTVKIASDSLLRQLPPEMAQMMAKRLKAAALGAMTTTTTTTGASSPPAAASEQSARPAGASGASGNASGQRAGGAPDLQRLISHAPPISLADLHKGDAVVILSTEGAGSGTGTAITLVSGVEPILQAAPNAGQAMMLAPWSLGAPAGGDAGP